MSQQPTKFKAPYGYADALDTVASAAAPLLAGFAFVLIGLLLEARSDVAHRNLALLLLVAAVLLLVFAVQFAFTARQYYLSPADLCALLPVAETDGFDKQTIEDFHVESMGLYSTWAARMRHAYNLGVFFMLAGVAVALIPGGHHPAPLRIASAGLAAAAAAGELTWIALYWTEPLRRRLKARRHRPSSPASA